jgi:7-keto-8-aminopelargonate synthetase-like enzyme
LLQSLGINVSQVYVIATTFSLHLTSLTRNAYFNSTFSILFLPIVFSDSNHESVLLPNCAGPIQGVVVRGNERCIRVASELRAAGFDCFPIRAPTVPAGEERIRIILHAHNDEESVVALTEKLKSLL